MKTRIYSYTSESPRITAKTVARWLEIIVKMFGRITSVSYRESESEHVIDVTVEEKEND